MKCEVCRKEMEPPVIGRNTSKWERLYFCQEHGYATLDEKWLGWDTTSIPKPPPVLPPQPEVSPTVKWIKKNITKSKIRVELPVASETLCFEFLDDMLKSCGKVNKNVAIISMSDNFKNLSEDESEVLYNRWMSTYRQRREESYSGQK